MNFKKRYNRGWTQNAEIITSQRFNIQISRKCLKKTPNLHEHLQKNIQKHLTAGQTWRAIALTAFRYIFFNIWMLCQTSPIHKPI